jgi:dipeptidyl aminopeptidase/acylaminoacyl peptidase
VYGDGELRIEALLGVTDAFTRTLVSYPSDDLTIFGFMDVPRGEGPFPVVVVLHGYVDPARYHTLTYTTHYADALARAGYIAIHPNLRGYAPSGDGPNMFRTGMAVDVLNLLALARKQAGQPGPLERADGDALGLWGHSMGGGITLRTLTVSPDVDAAVLYGAMSGDERQNYEQIRIWSGGQRGLSELDVPEDALQRISPIYYLDRITAAVSIHHGDNDGTVPLAWSEDLCRRLQDLGKPVECYTYAGQPHTFTGEGDALFIRRTIEFFDARLKAQR